MNHRGLCIRFAVPAFAVIALLASSLACSFSGLQAVRGSGRMEEQTVRVADFSAVALTNQGDLTIQYGDQEDLVVEAEANLLPYLEVRVVDHTLRLGTRPGVWLRPTRPIQYRLTVTEFSAIRVTGSGDVRYAGAPAVREDTNGSGDVKPLPQPLGAATG